MKLLGNEYNRAELAGAFGDLGTFVPFVLGYITLNKMDPLGILLAFGIFKIFVGFYFRTPMSVQPMKAIGMAAIANPGSITHGMIWGSGLFTAVFWFIMGTSGAVSWVAKLTAKPVVRGIMLGLGMSFIVQGLELMREEPFLALAAAALTVWLLTNEKVPAMLALLGLGVAVSFYQKPSLVYELSSMPVRLRLPEITLFKMSWREMAAGIILLGIPQIPLTLGNAVIAITAENNELFPEHPVTEKKIAIDHGVMNGFSFLLGGVPMCHGAGGMAGHVRFGARTGGALVILGVIVTALALFLSDSATLLLNMFPHAILGTILLFTGAELASSIRDIRGRRANVLILILTAGIAIWNMGVAFLAGVALFHLKEREVIRL